MGTIENGMIFKDRKEAGLMLGKMLEKEYKDKNTLVLGIPRGGIVVACEVATLLHADLSVVITKKLPHPLHDEFAIGAAAEDGSVFLSPDSAGVNFDTIQEIVRGQSEEIERRIQRFRHGRALPDMQNRIVIIVDDGIATGSTLLAAIKLCKAHKAARIVVAVPVAGQKLDEIKELADDLVVIQQPNAFQAVGQVYLDFHQLTDNEVNTILEAYNQPLQTAAR